MMFGIRLAHSSDVYCAWLLIIVFTLKLIWFILFRILV